MDFNPLKLVNRSKEENYCSPKNKNNLGFTCFSKNDILELIAIYNNEFCDNNKNFCYKHKIIKIRDSNNIDIPIKQLYDELKNKLIKFNKKYEKEFCWLKIKEFKRKFINKENLFVPQMPYEWCSDIKNWRMSRIEAPWLSNYDIDNIIEQYEYRYNDFKFLGSSPIDFRKKKGNTCVLNIFMSDSKKAKWLKYNKSSNYCDFNPLAYKDKNIFGIVFNTDVHTGGGRHWMGLYINLNQKIILFFDSAVTYKNLHPEIKSFVDNIKQQYKHINFTFKYNTVQHQQSNSECGMYSIYFILTMLDADKNNFNSLKAFDMYFNNSTRTVKDKLMVLYRTKLFRECNC